MAGGGIVSVEQDPEKKDRYYALTGTGEKLSFHGEPGKKLFDQYSTATADAGGFFKNAAAGALGSIVPGGNLIARGAENISKSDAAPPPLAQEPPPQVPPPREQEPPPQVASAQQAAPTPQPASQAAPPAASPTPQVGPLGYSIPAKVNGREVEGPAYMTPEGVRVFVPGTQGSHGGLTGLGKQTLEHMTETERTVAEAREREEAARQEGVLAARLAAQQQAAFQDEAEVQAFARAQELDTDIKEMERKLKDKDIAHAQAETAFTESRVDPDRYMKGNWLATLGMAFGAFGASLGKTQNFAQEFVQARIAQDIRAQETAIELKGKHADNALADLKRQFGSLEEAKSAYEQFMTKASAAKFHALALRSTDAAEKAKNEEISASLMGKYALLDQERKIRNQEKIWGERMYYRQGTAGTTGGFVVPTQEGFYKRKEERRQDEELRLKAEADKAAREGGGKIGEATKKSIADIDASIAGLQNMDKLDKDSGNPYLLLKGGSAASEESQRLTAAARAVGPGVARATEGDAATKESMEAAKEGLLARSGDERKRAREQYVKQLLEKRKALLETQ
jgi:hypothetical protein